MWTPDGRDMEASNIHSMDMAIDMEHIWAHMDARYVYIDPRHVHVDMETVMLQYEHYTCRYG